MGEGEALPSISRTSILWAGSVRPLLLRRWCFRLLIYWGIVGGSSLVRFCSGFLFHQVREELDVDQGGLLRYGLEKLPLVVRKKWDLVPETF